MHHLRVISILPALFALAACNASYPFQPSSRTPVAVLVVYRFGGIGPITVGAGLSTALNAYAIDADGVAENVTFKAMWESSNANVARINPGIPNFTAVAPGVADMVATYGGLSGRLTIRVTEPVVGYPRLEIRLGIPTAGGSTIQAGVFLADGQSRDVSTQATWTTLDPRIATVMVSPPFVRVVNIAPGNTEVTAVYEGVSASFTYSNPP